MKHPVAYRFLFRASFVLALFVLFVPGCKAQEAGEAPLPNTTVGTPADSTFKAHNPNLALTLSAVLPGAGQVYNHQAWKIPIIYAALGGIGYYAYDNYTKMKQHKDEYLYRVNHDGATQNPDLVDCPTANVLSLYESYDKTFQLSIIIGVAAYGLNLLDAYIFGQLYDFNTDNDLALSLRPTLEPMAFSGQGVGVLPGFALSLRF